MARLAGSAGKKAFIKVEQTKDDEVGLTLVDEHGQQLRYLATISPEGIYLNASANPTGYDVGIGFDPVTGRMRAVSGS